MTTDMNEKVIAPELSGQYPVTGANPTDLLDTLIRENEKLRKKNEELELFSYIISHDLRMPVANLVGLIQLVDDTDIGDPDLLKIFRKIDSVSSNLNHVVSDLDRILGLSRPVENSTETVCLKELISMVRMELAADIENAGVRFELNFAGDFCLKSVKVYVQRILHNLISNAIKFRTQTRQPVITITAERTEGGGFRLMVHDNGTGINLDKFGDDIFTKFTRFHTWRKGNGLGLFLVKWLVDALSGEITVESTPHSGSSFRMEFPGRIQTSISMEP